MVLLISKINKLYSKLENNLHPHHHSQSSDEALISASLEAFFSEVLSALSPKLSSSETTFSWIETCFEIIPTTSKAFARLVVAIDHPVSRWESKSIDKYLSFTLTMLELFNSISSALSHLSHARVSLSHGLSLKEEKPASLALKHLKPVGPFSLANNKALVAVGENRLLGEEAKGSSCSSKEAAIHRAMLVMESLGYWACGVVLSSLCGGDFGKVFGGGFVLNSSVVSAGLDSSLFNAMAMKKVELVKEVRDLNESVVRFVAAIGDGNSSGDEADELKKRLEVFERSSDSFSSNVDHHFHELLRSRNHLVEGFQVQSRKK